MTVTQLHWCPHCHVRLTGERIPQSYLDAGWYGEEAIGAIHFYDRRIGFQVPSVHAGTLFWVCPDCTGTWNPWPEDHPLHEKADYWMAKTAHKEITP